MKINLSIEIPMEVMIAALKNHSLGMQNLEQFQEKILRMENELRRLEGLLSVSGKKNNVSIVPVRESLSATVKKILPKPAGSNTIPKPERTYNLHKQRVCAKCGKEFQPAGAAQKYCSAACGMKKKWVRKTRPENTPLPAESEPSNGDPHQNVTESPAGPKPSYYRQKLLEQKKAKEEEELIQSLREHPKIDWDKQKTKHPLETYSL